MAVRGSETQRLAYLIDALAVEEVAAADQPARLLARLIIAQAHEAALAHMDGQPAVAMYRACFNLAAAVLASRRRDAEEARCVCHVLCRSHWRLGRAEERRQEKHVLVRRAVGEEAWRREDWVILRV